MASKTVTVLLIVISYQLCVTLCCDYETTTKTAKCNSLQQLLALKSNTDCISVKVINNGNEDLSSLSAAHLKNVPNVEELYFNGVLNNIEPQTFKDLPNLTTLYLENNKLHSISPDTFGYATIRFLVVNNSDVHDLEQGCLQNLPNLEVVSITGNQIATIKAEVFTNANIQELDLTQNGIQFIENKAFAGMKNLQTLKLSNNELIYFYSLLLMDNSPNLTTLNLNGNKMHSLTRHMFKGMENLRYLDVSNNAIEILTDGCFSKLKNIQRIDIAENNIKDIPATLFPSEGLKKLRDLFLHENRLCFLSPELFKRLPNLNFFSYGGNPWQCPCWELLDKWITEKKIIRVCHDEYTSGNRPECIITKDSPQNCIYDKEKLRDVRQTFFSVTSVYSKIPRCIR